MTVQPQLAQIATQEWDGLRNDVFGQKKDIASLQASVEKISVGVQALSSKFDDSRKPNWVLVIGVFGTAFGILPAMAAGGLYIISGQIDHAVSPIVSKIASIETADAERDRKITDLGSTNNQQSRDANLISLQQQTNTTQITAITAQLATVSQAISTGTAERRAQTAEVTARLLEVEQQFAAVSNIENMRWADQLRTNAMTYEKLHPGERYPTDTFFPSSIFQSAPPPLSTK